MKDIVRLEKNIPVVSTLDMWEGLDVKHKAIIDLIRKYESMFSELGTLAFQKLKSGGRPTPFCFLNEEQATFLITLMKNSEVVVKFKLKLTKEFYRMKKVLSDIASQQQNALWLETRNAGKIKRREETDTIKKFVEYAVAQGSQNAERYYSNISTMQNKALFFYEQKFKNLRDVLNLNQLAIVICADGIVSKAIEDGMEQKLHYKDIYKLSKKRIESFAEIHGKTLIPAFGQKQIAITKPLQRTKPLD
jgi:phage regulator Rha-like protein